MSTAIEIQQKIDKLKKNKQVPDNMKEQLLKKYKKQLEALVTDPIDPGKGQKHDDKATRKRNPDFAKVKKSKTKSKYKEGQEVFLGAPFNEIVTIDTIKGFDQELGQNQYVVKFKSGEKETFPQSQLYANKKTAPESYYIEFLNKKKNFTKDKKYFATEEEAKEWGKKEFDNFNMDMIHIDTTGSGPKPKKGKKPTTSYKYKDKDIKTLTREECDELHKKVADRRAAQKKSEKKSKSKPVVEKVASSVVKGAKHVIKNVSAADIKDDPKGEIDKMKKFIELTRKYIADSRALLGEDYDKETVDAEVKELRDIVKELEKKYK